MNNSDNLLLLFTLSSEGFLVPHKELIFNEKNKFVYFVKIHPCQIMDENKTKVLIAGDCDKNAVNYLSCLTNEVS